MLKFFATLSSTLKRSK